MLKKKQKLKFKCEAVCLQLLALFCFLGKGYLLWNTMSVATDLNGL